MNSCEFQLSMSLLIMRMGFSASHFIAAWSYLASVESTVAEENSEENPPAPIPGAVVSRPFQLDPACQLNCSVTFSTTNILHHDINCIDT
jgi:hypothetical protein